MNSPLLTILFCLLAITTQNLFAQDFNSKIKHLDLDELSKADCYYLDSTLQLSGSELNEEKRVELYYKLQSAYESHAHYALTLKCTDTLINIYKRNDNLQELADTYRDKSMLHDYLGQYPNALKASLAGLKIYQNIGDQSGEAASYNDIGVLHYYFGNQDLARNYFNESLKIFEKLNDTAGIGMYYNNMANTLYEDEDLDEALEMYEKAHHIDVMRKDLAGQSISLSNIGETYTAMEKYSKAEKVLLEALEVADRSNDQWAMTNPLRGLGELYQRTNELHKAIRVLKQNVEICSEIGAAFEQSQNYNLLYQLHKKNGEFEKALLYHELYMGLNDSIFNKEKDQMISEMEMKYQLSDKAREIELITKQKEIASLQHDQEMQTQRSRQIFLIIGLAALAVILVIAVRNSILRKRVNQQLQEQNEIIQQKNDDIHQAYVQIEEKNKEILDSIRYAKRIQSAILPPKSRIQQYLPKAFILYQPKDVVAGDFYWLEQKHNRLFLAAADCTGHGVPGAMVSVVCNNGLNRSVRETGLTVPGQILNKTREIVLEEFEKSEEKVNDGMDIALVSIPFDEKSVENKFSYDTDDSITLRFSGAHNPLWIIRKDSFEIEEYKANKQPIGKFEKAVDFDTVDVKLFKGDTFYLFTDGFADQFGGEKGKKMKKGNFKKVLLSLQQLDMKDQKEKLHKDFENWRGDYEQIDDVCVIGVRV